MNIKEKHEIKLILPWKIIVIFIIILIPGVAPAELFSPNQLEKYLSLPTLDDYISTSLRALIQDATGMSGGPSGGFELQFSEEEQDPGSEGLAGGVFEGFE